MLNQSSDLIPSPATPKMAVASPLSPAVSVFSLSSGDLTDEDEEDSPIPKKTIVSKSTTPDPPQFPLFRKLPPEIRHMIWSLHVDPRIVKLVHKYGSGRPRFISRTPVLLRCTRESRDVGLHILKHRFLPLKAKNKAYFDFDTDVLDFTNTDYETGSMPNKRDWSRIQKAIVSGPKVASRLSGLKEVWVAAQLQQTSHTLHTVKHHINDACYVQLKNQAAPPLHYAYKCRPSLVLKESENQWKNQVESSGDRKVKRLKKMKNVFYVSTCRLERKGPVHWGGESGCG